MRKWKWNKWAVIFLCVFLCFLLCGCGRQAEKEYIFSDALANVNDNQEEQVWLKVDGSMRDSLLLFSILDQNIIERYDLECKTWDFAVTNSSIYFLDRGELWKINRKTMEQEDTGIGGVYRLATHNGYIFYGDEEDIFVFHEERVLPTDAVSLQEQFPQSESKPYKSSEWPPIGEKQEIVFEGWRIRRIYLGGYGYKMWDVAEEESGEIIMGPEDTNYIYSHGWLPDYTGSYTVRGDDEWITLQGPEGRSDSGSPIIYQRDGEMEEHPIQCLTARKYKYSRIGKDFILEDGKLVGSITVCRGAKPFDIFLGRSSGQDDADYDELFELDIEADTSRVLYSTKKDQAQIVGYKSGKVYCFLDGRIYRESLTDGTREWMLDLREGEWSQYWRDYYSIRDSVSVYWQGDYMIIYMGGGIKSYFIPD